MVRRYSDYNRDRIGWFFGLTGWQLGVCALSALPVLLALQRGAWTAALALGGGWVLVAGVVVVPVRGRSAAGWFVAAASYLSAGRTGWSRWRGPATVGGPAGHETGAADLPGVLQPIEVHDLPPSGASLTRVALVQHHAARTWAVTAAVVMPGIGMLDADGRDRLGEGLTGLIDVAARTELVDEVLLTVRTGPDDGAERDLWVADHRHADGPPLARAINDDLRNTLTAAGVQTEQFLTLVVPESRISRPARECGGGLEGRARVLSALMDEIDAYLRGGLAARRVDWLTSPQLAVVCRTGFAPADRAGLVVAAAAHTAEPTVNPDIPWALAGPSGADTAVRSYRHDAWRSVSATVQLPARGALLGDLAPVLTPSEPGERRSLVVAYPILRRSVADRRTANAEWAADLGEELRHRARVKQRARSRGETARARGVDAKLARGHALTRPYTVCTVTVAATAPVEEYGRRLDAAIRRAGFSPLRLDLAQDVGFAASTIPLGVSLTRRSRT